MKKYYVSFYTAPPPPNQVGYQHKTCVIDIDVNAPGFVMYPNVHILNFLKSGDYPTARFIKISRVVFGTYR